MNVSAAQSAARLPPLREEIAIFPGPAALDGAPTWTLHDPTRNRFFRIGWPEFEMLSRWSGATVDGLWEILARETTLEIEREDILDLARFVSMHDLARAAGPQQTAQLLAKAQQARQSWGSWLLQHYLFMRVPLVRPDRALTLLYPLVSVFFTRGFFALTGAVAVAGLYLIARQWDVFRTTLVNLFSIEGLILFGITLGCVKVLHELAHAFTAKRFGCRVPHMGVAFLVFVPVLYTDLNDAWKLSHRRQRLAIGIAGVTAELCCAAYAALVWSFLPPSPARSMAFLVATTTWVTSLLLNLSPFMRFDGYYVLSDWLDTPNLHSRAFALARWSVRELIFGLGDPAPESWPERRRRLLIAFAFLTWSYRFLLFAGIAAIVYHFTFKVAGVVLGAIEVGYFVVAPVMRELVIWWRRRREFHLGLRTGIAFAVLAIVALMLLVPWRSTIEATAVLKSRQRVEVFTPDFATQLERLNVRAGDRVKEGDVLVQLAAPDIEYKLGQARKEIQVFDWQIAARGTDADLLARSLVTEGEYERARAEYQSLLDQQGRLAVAAHISGRVVDIADGLNSQGWLAAKLKLMTIVDPAESLIEAYVYESDLERVHIGDWARFFSDADSLMQVECRVIEIARASTQNLSEPALASVYGGPLAVRRTDQKTLVPDRTIYRVSLKPLDQSIPPVRVLRGTVLLEGERVSLAFRAWRAALAVFVRESGF